MTITRFRLTSYQLKWIALIFMTIDHLAVRFEAIPMIAFCVPTLRLLGRIAAPLFLFVLTESVRHTRSKPMFIFRLYIAGIFTELFKILTNLMFSKILVYSPGNIFFTYFYTAVYIYIIENIIKAVKQQDIKKILLFVSGILFTIIPQLVCGWSDSVTFSTVAQTVLFRDILTAIFPPTLYVEYSLLFVLIGVLFYFVKEIKLQCIIFLCFCALSFWGSSLNRDLWPFNHFFEIGQYWMVLALPFMLLYNGQKGKSHKALFYVYYPVHRYLISFLAALIQM